MNERNKEAKNKGIEADITNNIKVIMINGWKEGEK
jgi:hypothetical protein